MMKSHQVILRGAVIAAICLSPLTGPESAVAQEVGMFGGSLSRNMVSAETGLPESWDIRSGKNVLWTQTLGSQSYGGPVVAGGKIFIGTNNENPRDEAVEGDKGVLMVFQAVDGEFLWQIVFDKLPAGRVHDWPLQGICSTPYIEGDRLYYVSNQATVECADTEGFRDGENDGSITDETRATEADGDRIWSLDMIGDLDVFPHNLAVGNPLIVGDLLFTVTGNGVDEGHLNIPTPMAPSFIAVDKNTGQLVWESAAPGDNILHGQWSNPAYGVIAGRPQVVFPGGDGWIYSLNPDNGELLWKFDCNPKDSVWELGGIGTRNSLISTPVIFGDRVFIAVGQDPEHGEGDGNLWAIDATGSGDVTASHQVWHRGGQDFHRTISSVAIADGLLYAADLTGRLFCLDLETGEEYWMYDAFAAVWGSPFVADGRVYLGDEDGDIAVLKHGKKMELLQEINMGAAVYTTPVAHDGILYITSRNQLFALKEGIEPAADDAAAGR